VQKISSDPKAVAPKVRRTAAASTGCLGCHINATAANNKTLTDHSFLFLEAK
jgi:hypothetical protein